MMASGPTSQAACLMLYVNAQPAEHAGHMLLAPKDLTAVVRAHEGLCLGLHTSLKRHLRGTTCTAGQQGAGQSAFTTRAVDSAAATAANYRCQWCCKLCTRMPACD